ncbi:MAG: class I SAM-dependent methyltransferase, partial [Anaerolineae bacterium]|nr:class I SAM-dependent methyltransferase [Anaerolineae bacterium]
ESGQRAAQALVQGLSINQSHKVLEVGCGVARIGRELAPHCGEWWGCDISSSIIRIAKQRTAHLKNVNLKVLSDNSLRDFNDNEFDRVYCHAVFMHIPQIDIFAYIKEMGRVTKPGGLIFYDALNLSTEEGWARFVWEIEHYKGREVRPIHHSRFATPQELIIFTRKAGLQLLYCLTPKFFVQIVATKAEGSKEELRKLVDPEALAFI